MEGDGPGYLEIPVTRHGPGGARETVDLVAVEHGLAVEFGGRAVATLSCTPEHLEELVAGFLLGQGLLPASARPGEVGWECQLGPGRAVARAGVAGALPGEGREAVPAAPRTLWTGRIPSSSLSILAAKLDAAPLFQLTGAAHSALAGEIDEAGEPSVIVAREDIGRHNAVAKVLGHLWLAERLPARAGAQAARPGGLKEPAETPASVLVTSGRVSSDVVLRAARLGFPFLVSRGAPTVLAVEAARELGVTLAGFARGGRLNVYSHGGKVGDSQERSREAGRPLGPGRA